MSPGELRPTLLQAPLAERVWAIKYRHVAAQGVAERSIVDTWDRVAAAVSKAERGVLAARESALREILQDFRFLPAGRILAGAGTGRQVTLASCFVMGPIADSSVGIADSLRRSALTLQWGGGIGCNFSTLHPRGSHSDSEGVARGPVEVMKMWDAMCAALLAGGSRRGAMMATLRCDHADVGAFVDAKRDVAALRNFNLSVAVTDDFMATLAEGRESLPRTPGSGETARALWNRMMSAAYDTGDPGVLFLDRINRWNNLYYCEEIAATNPCGEIPLPSHGACVLGSINLTAFVRQPFTRGAFLDLHEIARVARLAVRFLDDVIDVSQFPLPEQAEHARSTRRVGLGVTGLADALIFLGLHYDSDAGRAAARRAVEVIRDAAYGASIELATERGAFPLYERDAYLAGYFVAGLPAHIRDGIARAGLRNSHLLAIAPTGTISLLANNVSSGIEPVFAFEGERRVLAPDGSVENWSTIDFALDAWRRGKGGAPPRTFVTAQELTATAHLEMVAALQPLVDNSISKTINVAANTPPEAFADVYERAYGLGLKGCTVFRPNAVRQGVLRDASADPDSNCCEPTRRAA
jgi:ribonucleoside-diphosphate reductase alpha chain